jgi:hypothetical protein
MMLQPPSDGPATWKICSSGSSPAPGWTAAMDASYWSRLPPAKKRMTPYAMVRPPGLDRSRVDAVSRWPPRETNASTEAARARVVHPLWTPERDEPRRSGPCRPGSQSGS